MITELKGGTTVILCYFYEHVCESMHPCRNLFGGLGIKIHY